jgi:hypothetical protein
MIGKHQRDFLRGWKIEVAITVDIELSTANGESTASAVHESIR